jgi:hypothetical protein
MSFSVHTTSLHWIDSEVKQEQKKGRGPACVHRLTHNSCTHPCIHAFVARQGLTQQLFFLNVGGSISVDKEKCRKMYGENVDIKNILNDKVVDPPPAMSPLYGELSRIINCMEKVSVNPARTSASLERFSTGVDPDQALVDATTGRILRTSCPPAL